MSKYTFFEIKKSNNRGSLKETNYSFSLRVSSEGGKILIEGSLNTFLFAIFFSNVNRREGSKIKLETMAKSRVIETRPPKAMVPPKLDNVNTKKPKNNTIEV